MARNPNILKDGFRTLITFSELNNAAFEVKSITPVGIETGGTIDTTTMENSRWSTNITRKLLQATQVTVTAAYSPEVFNVNQTVIGRNQKIFIQFPNGYVTRFWGAIQSFTPGENSEGNQPELTININCHNQNNYGEEIGVGGYFMPAPAYGLTASLDMDLTTPANSKALLSWIRSVTLGVSYQIDCAVRAPTVDGSSSTLAYGALKTVSSDSTEQLQIVEADWAAGSVFQTVATGTGTAIDSWSDITQGSLISFRITVTKNGMNSMRLIANVEVPVSGEVSN